MKTLIVFALLVALCGCGSTLPRDAATPVGTLAIDFARTGATDTERETVLYVVAVWYDSADDTCTVLVRKSDLQGRWYTLALSGQEFAHIKVRPMTAEEMSRP